MVNDLVVNNRGLRCANYVLLFVMKERDELVNEGEFVRRKGKMFVDVFYRQSVLVCFEEKSIKRYGF